MSEMKPRRRFSSDVRRRKQFARRSISDLFSVKVGFVGTFAKLFLQDRGVS